MVDLFKRMFGKVAPPEKAGAPVTEIRHEPQSQARTDEARLAARRTQISNDLFELQQIAMAELELRREQDAAAARAGFEADETDRSDRALIV